MSRAFYNQIVWKIINASLNSYIFISHKKIGVFHIVFQRNVQNKTLRLFGCFARKLKTVVFDIRCISDSACFSIYQKYGCTFFKTSNMSFDTETSVFYKSKRTE